MYRVMINLLVTIRIKLPDESLADWLLSWMRRDLCPATDEWITTEKGLTAVCMMVKAGLEWWKIGVAGGGPSGLPRS